MSRSWVVARYGGGAFHQAALDAADGHLWPVERVAGEPLADKPLAATQRRAIQRSAALLGLDVEGRDKEILAAQLGIPGLDHELARASWASARNRRTRGEAVRCALEALCRDEALPERLLVAGHCAGLWGEPWLCDPLSGRQWSLLRGPPPTSFALSAGTRTP